MCARGVTVLLVTAASPVLAQTDPSEQIEALERQLDSVEQSISDGQAMMAEIRKQLAALKGETGDSGQGSGDGVLAPAVAASPPPSESQPPPGQARAEVAEAAPQPGMQGAVNPLQENRNYVTGDDLLDEAFPGSIPIFGTDWRFAIRGYAKLDLIQDFDYVGDRFEFYVPSIPVEGTPEASLDGRNTMHAKETRIGFDFRKTATRPNGDQYPLQAFLEFDFFDDRESFRLQPRLRHAYGVIGRFLAGQSWNTSGDLSVLAGTIDFNNGDALYGGRVAQVRFADRLNETTTWGIAVEENDSEIANPSGFEGQNRPETPNLAGYLRWTKGRAHLGLGYDVFGLSWQGGDTGPSDTEIGWGLSLTGSYLVGAQSRNKLSTQMSYGDGSAFRVISLIGTGSGAVLTDDGTIETNSHWSAYGAYNHYWTDALNSTFILAHAQADAIDLLPGDTMRKSTTAHVNLIWFPYKSVSTGVELMWGERENQDGISGDATRFQAMVKYKFN